MDIHHKHAAVRLSSPKKSQYQQKMMIDDIRPSLHRYKNFPVVSSVVLVTFKSNILLLVTININILLLSYFAN